MLSRSLKLIATSIALFVAYLPLYAGSLIEKGAQLELISNDFELADGPSWNGSRLLIPDVKGEKIYAYDPKSGKLETFVPDAGRISASYYNNGRLYLSENAHGRISWLNQSKRIEPIAGQDLESNPRARPNDLVADDQGGIYYTLTGPGQVVYIDPDGKQQIAVSNIASPNGLILSPDQNTLYVAATGTKKIWAYPLISAGKTGPGTLFAAMDSGPDRAADGMCVDRAGNVYCAGPKHIWVWSPSGKLMEKIEMPERPINCAFGDSDMRSLYITGFGGLHRIRMNAYGVPSNPPFQAKLVQNPTKRPTTEIPSTIESHLNVVYDTDGDRKLLCDIFRPAAVSEALPAIIVVHGGGWRNGSKSKFRGLSVEIARRGYVSVAIEYRLGHEALFPAGIQDCNAATKFIKANAHRYGIDAERIGAVGGSAGGHLVGLMATGWENSRLQRSPGFEEEAARLDVAIVMAGPLQMTTGSVAAKSRDPKSGSNANVWLGKSVDEDPDLYALADAHIQVSKGDSPLYFLVGEHDQPERNQATRDALTALGITNGLKVYEDGKHGCWNNHPWFTPMVDDMVEIFERHL